MNFIERDNVKIAYDLKGNGDTTLLFVHGSFIDSTYWSGQVDHFARQYKVLVLDLPGHGASGKNRTTWTMAEYGKDVCALISALQLKNVILVGHSMGGDVILETAAQCPDAVIGFVAVDTFKNAGTAPPDEIQRQIDQIMVGLKADFPGSAEQFAKLALLSPSTDAAIIGRVVSDYRRMDKDIGIDLISSVFTYHDRQRTLLTKLKFKLHLINVDNIPTNEGLLEKYAADGYEVTEIKGTSHFPMIEHPVEFNEALQETIEKITTAQ